MRCTACGSRLLLRGLGGQSPLQAFKLSIKTLQRGRIGLRPRHQIQHAAGFERIPRGSPLLHMQHRLGKQIGQRITHPLQTRLAL